MKADQLEVPGLILAAYLVSPYRSLSGCDLAQTTMRSWTSLVRHVFQEQCVLVLLYELLASDKAAGEKSLQKPGCNYLAVECKSLGYFVSPKTVIDRDLH